MTIPYVRCAFYIRSPASKPGKYQYLNVDIESWGGYGLPTPHPPAVGDLVNLNGKTFRVIERAWSHPQYGSADWPRGEPQARQGPQLDVVVEHAVGVFADDVEDDE